jgi:hypothetical protein
LKPVVFEKSRGLSGRAASRSRGDVRFDHGANFFRLDDPAVEQIIRHELPTDDLVEIHGDVWTFDATGELKPGDPRQNAEPKFTYRNGISQLGKLLVEVSEVEVRRQTAITKMDQVDGRWSLSDSDGVEVGRFDRVILTAPAPQCHDLVQASSMNDSLHGELLQALAQSRFHRQFTFVLGYEAALTRSQPFHALVSRDASHAVAWLSFEEDKPGHLPEGQGAVIVQMSPSWTDERVDVDRTALLEEVIREAGALIGEDFRPPDWWDSQRWMMAHPAEGVDGDALKCGHAHGLFFAGDALPGKGRVPLAMMTGLAAADCLRDSLNSDVR